MEKESLNRKLAEWVGFKYEVKVSDTYRSIPECWKLLNRVFWKLPDFTQSLDACFKWLVPKLDPCQKSLVIERWAIKILLDRETEPAFALCLVIEKLIGRVVYPKRCPESRQTVFYPVARCNLNDKLCILETDGECPTYEDWLFEERQEELDHPEKHRIVSLVPTWLQEFEKEAGYEMGT